jgi:hypothetical protein
MTTANGIRLDVRRLQACYYACTVECGCAMVRMILLSIHVDGSEMLGCLFMRT